MDFDESRYRKLLQEHIDREVKAANEIIGKKDDAGKQRVRCMMALDELSGKRGLV